MAGGPCRRTEWKKGVPFFMSATNEKWDQCYWNIMCNIRSRFFYGKWNERVWTISAWICLSDSVIDVTAWCCRCWIKNVYKNKGNYLFSHTAGWLWVHSVICDVQTVFMDMLGEPNGLLFIVGGWRWVIMEIRDLWRWRLV